MIRTSLLAAALTLGMLAALCFVAGAPHFDLIPRTYANFAGIALGMFSGLFWVLFGLAVQKCKGSSKL